MHGDRSFELSQSDNTPPITPSTNIQCPSAGQKHRSFMPYMLPIISYCCATLHKHAGWLEEYAAASL
jgi:hypothetical protein